MVSSVLWNFTTSTVKPVHSERRISPPSFKESGQFGVNGCDKVIFPALYLKVRFHSHDPILHLAMCIFIHFSSSISPRKACTMPKGVWSPLPQFNELEKHWKILSFMCSVFLHHTSFLRIYSKQNENNLWGCKFFALLKNKGSPHNSYLVKQRKIRKSSWPNFHWMWKTGENKRKKKILSKSLFPILSSQQVTACSS